MLMFIVFVFSIVKSADHFLVPSTFHKYAVKTGDRKNGVTVHIWDKGHAVDWDRVQVLECELSYWKSLRSHLDQKGKE